MNVTRFNFALQNSLLEKMGLMIKRCIQRNPKRDAVLLIEGAEGEGKTGLSVALGYYIAEQTNREFSHKNIFFDVEEMIKFLQEGNGKIAIWDEPALQALSGDALSKIFKNLKRMLMMCRNKRHFIIINMTYFTEFGGYIVWQRPLGMIHVYSKNELTAGRFIYIRKKKLERLWNDWKSKKQRNYHKYGSKRCRGSFPDVLNPDHKNNVLSEFDFQAYEKNKNDAINSIMKEKEKASPIQIRKNIIQQIIIRNENSEKKILDKDLMKLLGLSLNGFYSNKRQLHLTTPTKLTLINNKVEEKNEKNKPNREDM